MKISRSLLEVAVVVGIPVVLTVLVISSFFNDSPQLSKQFFDGSDLYYRDEMGGVSTVYSWKNLGNDSMSWGGKFDKKVLNADTESFRVINQLYGKDKNTVFYVEKPTTADRLTVSSVDVDARYYVKDKNAVYYKGEIIQSAHPESFSVLKVPIRLSDDVVVYSDDLAKDENSVFFEGKNLDNADAATLTVVERKNSEANQLGYYFKDKYQVWQHTGPSVVVLPGADPNTIELFDQSYAKDISHVYYGIHLTDLDPQSFEYIQESYVKDKNGVYCLSIREDRVEKNNISNADPSTFTVLNKTYTKDKQFVYYNNCGYPGFSSQIIDGADPMSFEVLKKSSARDKSHTYKNGEKQ